MQQEVHTARPRAPSRLLPRGSGPTGEPTPVRQGAADQALGGAHGGAPEQYGGHAPHYPPCTIAHSGRAEGGFRSEGAPGGAVHEPPLIPPTRGGPATPTERACRGGVRRRREGGQGREP